MGGYLDPVWISLSYICNYFLPLKNHQWYKGYLSILNLGKTGCGQLIRFLENWVVRFNKLRKSLAAWVATSL
jgi:hypothetical protein